MMTSYIESSKFRASTPRPGRGVALGIEVDHQDPVALLGEGRSEVHRGRGLADAPLLVGDGDDPGQLTGWSGFDSVEQLGGVVPDRRCPHGRVRRRPRVRRSGASSGGWASGLRRHGALRLGGRRSGGRAAERRQRPGERPRRSAERRAAGSGEGGGASATTGSRACRGASTTGASAASGATAGISSVEGSLGMWAGLSASTGGGEGSAIRLLTGSVDVGPRCSDDDVS